MKYYDAKRVRELIKAEGDAIKSITLGMKEDLSWTASVVYRYGRTLVNLDKDTVTAGGTKGSIWATPIMMVEYNDGRTETMDCYIDDDIEASDKLKEQCRSFAMNTSMPINLKSCK